MEIILTASYIHSKSIKLSKATYEERSKKISIKVDKSIVENIKPGENKGTLLLTENKGLNMGSQLEMATPNTFRKIDMLNYELMGKRFQKHQIMVNVFTGEITKTEKTDPCKTAPVEPLNYVSYKDLEFFFFNDKKIIMRNIAESDKPEKFVKVESDFQPYYCGGKGCVTNRSMQEHYERCEEVQGSLVVRRQDIQAEVYPSEQSTRRDDEA